MVSFSLLLTLPFFILVCILPYLALFCKFSFCVLKATFCIDGDQPGVVRSHPGRGDGSDSECLCRSTDPWCGHEHCSHVSCKFRTPQQEGEKYNEAIYMTLLAVFNVNKARLEVGNGHLGPAFERVHEQCVD